VAWHRAADRPLRAAGFDVVMCPEKPCYFDHYQADGDSEPLAIGRPQHARGRLNRFEPVPDELDAHSARHCPRQ